MRNLPRFGDHALTDFEDPENWPFRALAQDPHEHRLGGILEPHREEWPTSLVFPDWESRADQHQLALPTLTAQVPRFQRPSSETLNVLNEALGRAVDRLLQQWITDWVLHRVRTQEKTISQLADQMSAFFNIDVSVRPKPLIPRKIAAEPDSAVIDVDWSGVEETVTECLSVLDWDVDTQINSEEGVVRILAQAEQIDRIADETGELYRLMAERLQPDVFNHIKVNISFERSLKRGG